MRTQMQATRAPSELHTSYRRFGRAQESPEMTRKDAWESSQRAQRELLNVCRELEEAPRELKNTSRQLEGTQEGLLSPPMEYRERPEIAPENPEEPMKSS
jgi:hypothetical protein